jgi:acylphosphatase
VTDRIRRRVVAIGHVQGVFFRQNCRRLAREAGVAGWIRNRADGAVEAVFEGDPESVDRMVRWARAGPRGARVDRLEVHEEPPEGLDTFDVTR